MSSENPIEDGWGNIENVDPDLEWGDMGEENEGGWDIERKEIISLGSLYIISLDKNEKRKKPFLCKCVQVITEDNTIHFEDEDGEIIIFECDFNDIIEIKYKTEGYELNELIRVKLLDVEKEDYSLDDNEIYFNEKIIENKDYSEIIIKDDLLSILIKAYDCYENSMINDIEELTNDLLLMIKNYKDNNTNNLKDIDNNKIPYSFIPLSDDKINYYDYEVEKDVWQRFENGNDINEEIIKEIENSEIGLNNYQSFIMNSINNIKSLKIQNDIGYIENNYNGIYLRNCFTESSLCDGINGEYKYDIRKSRDNFKRYKEKEDKIITENIINKDRINIVGLLQEPLNKSISYNHIINKSDLLEKIYLNELIMNRNEKEILKKLNINERILDLNNPNLELDEDVYI